MRVRAPPLNNRTSLPAWRCSQSAGAFADAHEPMRRAVRRLPSRCPAHAMYAAQRCRIRRFFRTRSAARWSVCERPAFISRMRHFPEWVGARVGGLRMSAPRNKAHNGNSLRRRAAPTACALQQHSRMPHSAGSRLRLPVSERGFYPAHGQDTRAFSSETTLGKFLTAPITHCI